MKRRMDAASLAPLATRFSVFFLVLFYCTLTFDEQEPEAVYQLAMQLAGIQAPVDSV